jgi:peptidylprolyl isomerase
MIQGGDPDYKNSEINGPGYAIPDELPPKDNKYTPGVLAMANSGADTGGSQFFICTGNIAYTSLNANPNYTQYGKVVEGMDVVLKIAKVDVNYFNGEFSKPTNPPVVNHITIEER